MAHTDPWTPPRGFVLAGPSSAAFHHLVTRGLVVNVPGTGTGIHSFNDRSALVAVDGKPFPLPLRMLGGPNNLPTPEDIDRIRALHAAGWAQHELWWTQVAADSFAYGQKLQPIAGHLGAYLAGKVRPLVEIKRIEFVLQGAAPDVPEDAPSEDACLMARIVAAGSSTSPRSLEAQTLLDQVCAQLNPFLFDADNPPRSWRWAMVNSGDQGASRYVRETPFVFRMAMSFERIPNAHETMALAHQLRTHTGVDLV
jgi:hypothetical protein